MLNNISSRMKEKEYISKQIIITITLAFILVFISNILAVIFSINIADISVTKKLPLAEYILGNMQMNKPLLFGFIWSIYKASLGALICFMGQIFAKHSKNIFIIIFAPFIYVFLENFVTGLFKISQFSFTTSFILNRLSPSAMNIPNLLVGIISFCIAIYVIKTIITKNYETD